MAVSSFTCAICGREIRFEGRKPSLYPFCTPRCKLVDLGKWFREQYAIDRDLAPEERKEGAAADQ